MYLRLNNLNKNRNSAARLILCCYWSFQMNDGKVNVEINIKRALSKLDSGPHDLWEMNNYFLHIPVLLKESTGQSCNLITSLIFSFVTEAPLGTSPTNFSCHAKGVYCLGLLFAWIFTCLPCAHVGILKDSKYITLNKQYHRSMSADNFISA